MAAGLGDLLYRGALAWLRLVGNTTTTPKVLKQVGDGVNSAAPEWSDEYATTLYVDEQIATVGGSSGASQTSFLVSGGQIVWIQNYDFIISAAAYYIDGVLYNSPETPITLDAADLTNDRIDVIVVQDDSTVDKVTGTAAPNPSEPDIDPATQLKLGIVLVPAASTEPTVGVESLYAEDAGGPGEWNWASSGASLVKDSTNNPNTGTKCIEGTAVVAGVYVQGTIPSSTYDPVNARLLILYIRSKASWANGRALSVSLRTNGNLIGSAVTISRTGTFGFNSATLGSYQVVAIPVTLFAVPIGQIITQVRITAVGAGHGFYIDDISFQEEGAEQVGTGITQEQADARYARKDESFITVDDETVNLPSSRRLVAGTNITFDDTVAGQRTVNAADTGLTVVDEDDLNFSDVTTANASTSEHGLLPKLPNDSNKYLNGTGGWSVPPAIGGAAYDYFFDDSASDIVGYGVLSPVPVGGVEDVDSQSVVVGDGEVLIEAYAAPEAFGVDLIPAGHWDFKLWRYVSSAVGVSEIVIRVYKRASGGAETELFNTTTGDIADTSVALQELVSTQLAFSVDPTDRLVVKFFAKTDSVVARTISFVHNGTTHYSNFVTPFLNDIQNFVGDSGSGGTHGLVPAPSAGDAAAGKFLSADGTWDVPSGDVVGTTTAVDNEIALFDGTTGKIIKRATGSGFVRAASGVYSASPLVRTIAYVIGDGTNVISLGVAGFITMPVTGTIISWRLLSCDAAATAGAIKIDVWRDTYANYPPTDADSITNGHEPEIAATNSKAEDTDLSDWGDVTISAGEVFGFNVDSVASLKRVILELTIQE